MSNEEIFRWTLSPWDPRFMLRMAVTGGHYARGGVVLSEEAFTTSLMSRFVEMEPIRCLETRQHLDMCHLAYRAYQAHHADPAQSEAHELRWHLFCGDVAAVEGALKAMLKAARKQEAVAA